MQVSSWYRPLLAGLLCLPLSAMAADSGSQSDDSTPVYGPRLEGFSYPHEVDIYRFESQRQPLEMAYMDVAPEGEANGRTAVLLHGKNFCGATWEGTIEALTQRGYRVIAPDQVGFCKSSKPEHYQYSLHQLAANTHDLLKQLGIDNATIMGHSMGGMLATRYALMYPEATEQLVLVDPIGLEDWKAKGVPYHTVDQWFESTRKTSAEGIRDYQKSTYYAGEWQPRYDKWVQMQAGMYRGEGKFINAWSQAKTYEMIYTQPVVHEFDQLQVPTLLMIGDQDNTAIGKSFAPPEVQQQLGHYDQLGPEIASRIPHALLIQFPELGHSPQIQAPEQFHQALFRGLEELDNRDS
ncbi:pimeloyl-ACP methyl ester carboxylesterase [Kushneria sinocarnis]|uniref:Pimeloyl-ACP methyl ester carboxylesterase n=1 Tax=Kushneria sinocarnis TaxID=595502 RepID=A0A420WUE1_9GAMM|nr:alpha/beta hydrolase [Kushneria sinocarnis]RKQ97040.1 pimeloyl-ACP methyl ester carboxylesterase [Kushneria sinocarnis]